MDVIWEELTHGLPDSRQLIHVLTRLLASVVLGATIGYQREIKGKPAGIKTHILASLGTATVVVACLNAGFESDALSRVIQGIVTGIGFLGAGAILKLDDKRDIQGLTTAASIWAAATIGVAVGLGVLGVAIMGTVVTLLVLVILGEIEIHSRKEKMNDDAKDKS